MLKNLSLFKYLLIISCIVFLSCGCASKKAKPGLTHAELLNKGLEMIKKGNPSNAITILQMLKDRYPYTESAIIAGLKLGDTYFTLDEYETAYDLYDEFEKLHPKDVNIPYVKYQKAMCYFNQIKSFDRQQTYVLRARKEFEGLIMLYPDNEYTVMARRNLRRCLKYLTQFEITTANFYFNQEKYKAALLRYTYAVNNFPDIGQYHEALEKIAICKARIAESGEDTVTEQ